MIALSVWASAGRRRCVLLGMLVGYLVVAASLALSSADLEAGWEPGRRVGAAVVERARYYGAE
jgi:hypothetical protein